MKTMSQLRKEAKEAPKFVLHTDEFGFDMFIADNFDKEVAMPTLKGAKMFSVGFDDEVLKCAYFSAITGYDLKVKYL